MMNRFTQFELVAVDLRNRNTRKQEILSQIVTNVAKMNFSASFMPTQNIIGSGSWLRKKCKH